MAPPPRDAPDLATYRFRGLHPRLWLGTASDRYAGWLGQIYPAEEWGHRVTQRPKRLGSRTFTEGVLPTASAAAYFEHFPTLELDFPFYRPLLDPGGGPSPSHRALAAYLPHLGPGDRLLLKAPQAVFARRIRRGSRFEANPNYLDARAFTERFWQPANDLLGDALAGVIFEQEYHRAADRPAPEAVAAELDAFFGALPPDPRYHVELRTDATLAPPVLDALADRGVGQVLSHWTWLPPLRTQFQRADRQVLNRGGHLVVRLMTPRGVRYEDAYARAHPFDRPVPGMMDPTMVADAAAIAREVVDRGQEVFVIANNRAGGNAPSVARAVAEAFLAGG